MSLPLPSSTLYSLLQCTQFQQYFWHYYQKCLKKHNNSASLISPSPNLLLQLLLSAFIFLYHHNKVRVRTLHLPCSCSLCAVKLHLCLSNYQPSLRVQYLLLLLLTKYRLSYIFLRDSSSLYSGVQLHPSLHLLVCSQLCSNPYSCFFYYHLVRSSSHRFTQHTIGCGFFHMQAVSSLTSCAKTP